MKHIARKWMAIAMAIALVFGAALAETEAEADALFEEGKAAYHALDYATALEKLSQIAEDNPEAQFLLGDIYRYSDKDYDKAVEWYRRAADAGNADGKAGLGSMYANGWGVEKDLDRAVALYTEAVEDGSDYGRTYLGQAYLLGAGVEQDIEKGVGLFEEAIANGNLQAKTTLGTFYCEGIGVEQDQQRGMELVLEAASEGDGAAKIYLMMLGVGYDDASAPDAVISADDSAAAPAVEAVTEITDKEQIQGVQQMLNMLGYDCGTPDGIAGKKTAEAVTRFQQDNGLTVTGTITDEVQAALAGMVSLSSAS